MYNIIIWKSLFPYKCRNSCKLVHTKSNILSLLFTKSLYILKKKDENIHRFAIRGELLQREGMREKERDPHNLEREAAKWTIH